MTEQQTEGCGMTFGNLTKDENAPPKYIVPPENTGELAQSPAVPQTTSPAQAPEAQETNTLSGETPPPVQTPPPETPRKFKLKRGSEDVEKEESEVVNLAQQGWDYQEKMRKLNEDKASLEKQRQDLQDTMQEIQESGYMDIMTKASADPKTADLLNSIRYGTPAQLAVREPAPAEQIPSEFAPELTGVLKTMQNQINSLTNAPHQENVQKKQTQIIADITSLDNWLEATTGERLTRTQQLEITSALKRNPNVSPTAIFLERHKDEVLAKAMSRKATTPPAGTNQAPPAQTNNAGQQTNSTSAVNTSKMGAGSSDNPMLANLRALNKSEMAKKRGFSLKL